MIAQEQLSGHWNQIKGKIREQWGQITEDDLQRARGEVDQLVGLIQEKTGEGRAQIEQALERMSEEYSSTLRAASSAARDYVDQGQRAVRDATEHMKGQAYGGYVEAQRLVRRRPTESVVFAFGAGLVAGIVIGLISRSR